MIYVLTNSFVFCSYLEDSTVAVIQENTIVGVVLDCSSWFPIVSSLPSIWIPEQIWTRCNVYSSEWKATLSHRDIHPVQLCQVMVEK